MPAASEPLPAVARRATVASPAPDLSTDAAARAVAAMGLLAVGVIHALQISGQLPGTAWLTAGFAAVAVAGPACALWLLARPGPAPWLTAGLLCLSVSCGYILTRTVPLPGDAADVGNWLEPSGLAALIIEGIVALLAALACAGQVAGLVRGRRWPAAARAGRRSRAQYP